MPAVALRRAEELDAFDALAHANRHLADVVQAISRRRDVRRVRSKLLLYLLRVRCPVNGEPAKPWYVPGAVTRLGANGIRNAWRTFHGEEPPSERTIRKHLSDLEAACCIVRSPGDWVAMMRDPEHPERRPRHCDTIHVIENERDAHWWELEGRALQRRFRKWRTNPDVWRGAFGNWRKLAREHQGHLFGSLAEELQEKAEPARAQGLELASALTKCGDQLDVLLALRRAGCRVAGKMQPAMMGGDPVRLLGAAALLAAALWRGDRIRTRAGWTVRAWRRAPLGELQEAIRALRRPWMDPPG